METVFLIEGERVRASVAKNGLSNGPFEKRRQYRSLKKTDYSEPVSAQAGLSTFPALRLPGQIVAARIGTAPSIPL